jgi:hypothetical protein
MTTDRSRDRRFAVGRRRLTLALLGMVVLSGCASFDPGAVRAKTEGKSILVASDLGSSLNLSWIGTTVFNNEASTHAADGLQLDGAALSTALWALQQNQRYRSVAAAPQVKRTSAGFPRVAGAAADYLLLIEPGTTADFLFRTNQFFRGVGVVQRSFAGATPRAAVHAVLQAELFDLRTGESLGKQTYTDFMDAPALLTSGPTIPRAALDPTLESAVARVQGAVISLVRVIGL